MADYPEEFPEFMRQLNLLLARYNSSLDQQQAKQKTAAEQIMQVFNDSMKSATTSLNMLHSSAEDTATQLTRLGPMLATTGLALTKLNESLNTSTEMFSKLTDVGQTFGSSMFSMQETAGKTGQTFDEFAAQVTKSSSLLDTMSRTQTEGITAQKDLTAATTQSREDILTQAGKTSQMLEKFVAQVTTSSGLLDTISRTQADNLTEFAAQVTKSSSLLDTMSRTQAEGITAQKELTSATIQSRDEIMKMITQAAPPPLADDTSLKLLHSSAQEAASQLMQWAPMLTATGLAIANLTDNLATTTAMFNKLTDVGQKFGSLLSIIQETVGKTGRTLDEFAAQVTKSSSLLDTMSRSQADSLTEFAAQVTKSSSLLDTLNRTQTESITAQKELTAATTQSREEIMKTVAQAAPRQQPLTDDTSLKLLHSSAQEAAAQLMQWGPMLTATGLAFTNLTDSLVTTTAMFHKLTDAGQKFADSLSAMQEMAGKTSQTLEKFAAQVTKSDTLFDTLSRAQTESIKAFTDIRQTFVGSVSSIEEMVGKTGHTLEQFAAQVFKSSSMLDAMSRSQAESSKAFDEYQKTVRDQIKPVGKSFADVEKATEAYVQTMRAQGQWEQMSEVERQKALAEYIAQVHKIGQETGKAYSEITKAASLAIKPPLDAFTTGLKVVHGSAQAAIYPLMTSMSKLGPLWLLAGGALSRLIDNLLATTQTFNKMADVGQTFEGSMFRMQQMAGDSGLTLEQFSTQVSKNSTLIATMGQTQVKGVKAFTDYQKGVREAIEPFGMFGMTLTQVNEAAGDYAETLRVQGRWSRMNDLERQQSSIDFITQVSGLAAATGKSREAIMKQVNEASRQPMTAGMSRLLTESQNKSKDSMMAGFAAMPGEAGQQLTKALGEMIASGGQVWRTEMFETANKLGRGAETDKFLTRLYARVLASNKFDESDTSEILGYGKDILADMQRISQIAGRGSGLEQVGTAMVGFATSIEGYDAQIMRQKDQDARGNWSSAITKAGLNFEQDFNKLTGAFRDGFYKAILNLLPGETSKQKIDAFNEMIKKAAKFLERLGEVVGYTVSLFVQIISPLEKVVAALISTVSAFNRILQYMLKLTGMGDDWAGGLAAVGTVLTGFIMYKKLMGGFRRNMGIEANTVIIKTKSLLGGGGSFADMLDGGGGGGHKDKGALKEGAAGAGRKGWFKRTAGRWIGGAAEEETVGAIAGVGGVRGLVRGGVGKLTRGLIKGGIGGMVVGAVMEGVGEQVIGALPVGEKAKEQMSDALEWAATGAGVGMVFGPMGALIGGLIGAAGSLFVNNLPTKEKAEQMYKGMMAPAEQRKLAANEGKIATVMKDLEQARSEEGWARTAPESSPQILKSVQDRIARLIDQGNELQAENLRVTKEMNETLENSWRIPLEMPL